MTSPAPARMSVARTGAPESRSRPRTTAWWPSVRMSAPSRTISFTNMNRPSKMFSVISEAPSLTAASPIAIGSRSVAKPGNGSVTMSTAFGRSVHPHPERRPPRVSTRPPAVTSLSSAISRKRRVDAVHRHVAAGHRRAERPGAGDDPVADGGVADRAQLVDALDLAASTCRRRSMRAPIPVSIAQMSTISGSRAALSISVTPLASTAAISRFSVAPTLGKSSQIVAPCSPPGADGDDEAVLAGDLGAHPGQAGDVHVQPARADRVAAGVRDPHVPAAGQQRAEHADRGAQPADQVVVGLGAGLLRHVDRHLDGGLLPARLGADSTSQPSRRSTSAMIAMSVIRGTLCSTVRPGGQQRGRHQLERGVLRADHPHLAGEPRPAPGSVRDDVVDRTSHVRHIVTGCVDVRRRLYVMAVHLTRIYTKTGDTGTTRLGNDVPGGQDRPADRRVRRRRRVQRRDRGGARPRRPARRDRHGADDRTERPVRRRRRSVHPDRRRTRSTRRCGSPRRT